MVDYRKRIRVDAKGRAMLRDTHLRVSDVIDMRARMKSDDDLLQRVTMLSREDLEACRQWIAEHPPGPGIRIPVWMRTVVALGVASWMAWTAHMLGASGIVWPAAYFVLSFIGIWSGLASISR
jgi:uncharacterized protein (DUF433 family)